MKLILTGLPPLYFHTPGRDMTAGGVVLHGLARGAQIARAA